MDVQELQEGTERAWRYVYSLPSIARRVRASPASPWIAVSANLGYRHYAHNLRRFYNCDWVLGSGGMAAGQRPAAAAALR
jgi:hypothetical protein